MKMLFSIEIYINYLKFNSIFKNIKQDLKKVEKSRKRAAKFPEGAVQSPEGAADKRRI